MLPPRPAVPPFFAKTSALLLRATSPPADSSRTLPPPPVAWLPARVDGKAAGVVAADRNTAASCHDLDVAAALAALDVHLVVELDPLRPRPRPHRPG
jgi:hypothetical protein